MTLPARTPLANEDLLPVSPDRRTWNWWHIASLWIGMAICIPTYTLASGLVDQGWTWQAAVGAVVLGNIVVLVPIALNSYAGTRYGIPFPVLARASFGVLGANVPAILRGLVACGWFGIQTWIGGWAIYKLFEAIWPGIATLPQLLPAFVGLNTGEFLCFMLFWAMNVWIVLRGMDSIKFLETWGSPFLLVVGAALFIWAWVRSGSLALMLQNPPVSPSARPPVATVFGAGLTSAVAFWGTMALFAFIGAAVTNATMVIFGTRIADPVALLARIGGPLMIILSMAGLTVATLTTNIAANIVAPANAFSNIAPHKISFKQGALITAVIGIVMMPWRLYNDAAAYIFTWLIGYGALLGPIAGIMIADYFVVRGGFLVVNDLYRRHGVYEYSHGVNRIAVGSFLLGVAPSLPGFIAAVSGRPISGWGASLYNWAWFVGFLIAAVVYIAGMRATRAGALRDVDVGVGAGD